MIHHPTHPTRITCTDQQDAYKVCRAVREYLDVVYVSLNLDEIADMIRIVTTE
jgi:hypothetical protein